jgi:hypothetical protein
MKGGARTHAATVARFAGLIVIVLASMKGCPWTETAITRQRRETLPTPSCLDEELSSNGRLPR